MKHVYKFVSIILFFLHQPWPSLAIHWWQHTVFGYQVKLLKLFFLLVKLSVLEDINFKAKVSKQLSASKPVSDGLGLYLKISWKFGLALNILPDMVLVKKYNLSINRCFGSVVLLFKLMLQTYANQFFNFIFSNRHFMAHVSLSILIQ